MFKQVVILLVGIVAGGWLVYLLEFNKTVEENPKEIPLPTIKQSNNAMISGYSLPTNISFAGEKVPLSRPSIVERLDREVQVNAFWHSNAVILIKRSNKWLPTIDSILTANEIPADFKYLAVAESGLQNVISPSNAVGFWQFLKGTAKDFGLIVNSEVDQRYDPVRSTVAATKYLKKAYKKFGNWTLVAASYNMGMNGISQVLAHQKTDSYYDIIVGEETARYVFRIIALKNLLENPSNFGFNIKDEDKYTQPKSKTIAVEESVDDWHEFAQEHQMTFYELKKLNPWIRAYKMKLTSGQEMEVKILAK